MIRSAPSCIVALLLCGVVAGGAHAQATPAGLWKTIDDETGKERSLVRIAESGGVMTGRIEKLLNPEIANPLCEKCSGEQKDQPITGLTILRGVRHSESDASMWDGGEILDPNNGKTYKVRLTPTESGRKLAVRGYIGTPLLGRTQTWLRVE